MKRAWRWLRSALAGVWPLSAATMPSGVDWKVPSVALPILLKAFWYSPFRGLLAIPGELCRVKHGTLDNRHLEVSCRRRWDSVLVD